ANSRPSRPQMPVIRTAPSTASACGSRDADGRGRGLAPSPLVGLGSPRERRALGRLGDSVAAELTAPSRRTAELARALGRFGLVALTRRVSADVASPGNVEDSSLVRRLAFRLRLTLVRRGGQLALGLEDLAGRDRERGAPGQRLPGTRVPVLPRDRAARRARLALGRLD